MMNNVNLEARQQIAALDQYHRFNKIFNKEINTLELTFDHILGFSQDLYQKLTANPLTYLTVLQQYIHDTIAPKAQLILSGDPIGQRITIPRDLSASQLCQMFKVVGIVTKTTQPNPSLRTLVSYDPQRKEHIESRYEDPYITLNPQLFAQFIPRDDTQQRQYGLSDFITVQKIAVQDCPEHVPQGRIPKSVQIILTQQLVDTCKSGDRVEIVGVLLPAPNIGPREQKQQQINIYLLATSVHIIQKTKLSTKVLIAENDIQIFLKSCHSIALPSMSISQPALDVLASSLAPSIYGHQLIKKAIVLQLLGGISRQFSSSQIRGDINVLLIGSPGCGKSQLLRAALNLSPIAMSASGRGSSGAGLTAAVIIEKSGLRTLQAGAFVLADGGLLCIDEFDKLQTYDRVAIHEAMEQQTVSISKAGIHATLNARCSVLAAANYVFGGFDFDRSIAENINLPDSLLSRFDLIFLVNDSQDHDQQIAQHVVQNHMLSVPIQITTGFMSDQFQDSQSQQSQQSQQQKTQNQKDVHLFSEIPIGNFLVFNASHHQNLLDRFAKSVQQTNLKPQRFLLTSQFLNNIVAFCRAQSEEQPYLSDEAVISISEFYSKLRRNESRGLLVTARALDSMIRLSTALAKLSHPPRNVSRLDVIEAYILVRHSLFGELESEIRRTVGQDGAKRLRAKQHKETVQDADPELDQTRYDLFVQAFSDIIEGYGGNSITESDLFKLVQQWSAERRELLKKQFTEREVRLFVERMAANIEQIVLNGGVIYF